MAHTRPVEDQERPDEDAGIEQAAVPATGAPHESIEDVEEDVADDDAFQATDN